MLPYRAGYWMRCRASELVLPLAMRELGKGTVHTPSRGTISRLRFGWNNDSFAADVDFLCAVAETSRRHNGNILECGSGLSTLLLAALTKNRVWTLEHSEEWLERTRDALRRFGLEDRAMLRHAPLKSYGDFSWYELPADLPAHFSVVVCDGPPALTTPGARYGLLPVTHERIRGSRIFLDDAQRAEERCVIDRWRQSFGVTVESDAEFSVLRVEL